MVWVVLNFVRYFPYIPGFFPSDNMIGRERPFKVYLKNWNHFSGRFGEANFDEGRGMIRSTDASAIRCFLSFLYAWRAERLCQKVLITMHLQFF